jgi:hypothetical protein
LTAGIFGEREMTLLCIDLFGEVEHRRRATVCHLLD